MRSRYWWGVAVACGFLVTAVPVVAHHSIASEYDFDKPVEITGVVTRVDWVNPHSVFHVEVTAQDGSKTVWRWQTGTAGALRRNKAFLGRPLTGLTLTVSGFGAKNGQPQGYIKTLTMPDGEIVKMWFGDPNG